MSFQAVSWAIENQLVFGTDKFVLVAFANYANPRCLAYPSNQTVARLTGYNIKTVKSAIARLRDLSLLIDTGERKGINGRVIVYRLGMSIAGAALEEIGPKLGLLDGEEFANTTVCAGLGGTENPIGPILGRSNIDRPNFGDQSAQNRATEPVMNHTPTITNVIVVPKGTETEEQNSSDPDLVVPHPAPSNPSSRLSASWQAPSISALPDATLVVVRHWPDGAYEDQAEAFRNYWLAESGVRSRKYDWDKAWLSWVRRAGQNVKAPPARPETARVVPPPLPVLEYDTEGEHRPVFDEVRRLVASRSAPSLNVFLSRCAFRFDEPGVSMFILETDRFKAEQLQPLVEKVFISLGSPISWLRIISSVSKSKEAECVEA